LIYRIYLCIFEFETLYTAVAEAKAGASVTSCNQRFTCYWSRFSEIPFKTFTTNDYQFVLYFHF